MSVRSSSVENLVDLSIDGGSSFVGGEDGTLECQCLRISTGFSFPLITVENLVVVTDFEGDVLDVLCLVVHVDKIDALLDVVIETSRRIRQKLTLILGPSYPSSLVCFCV